MASKTLIDFSRCINGRKIHIEKITDQKNIISIQFSEKGICILKLTAADGRIVSKKIVIQ